MIERTEELGLAARLPIVVGGRLVELRTLNLEESEAWQAQLATTVATAAGQAGGIDKPDPGALLATLAKLPATGMLELVEAYDVDDRLPATAQLRRQFTQAELYAAIKQMVQAELPFLADARSMAEAFGPQLRAYAASVLFSLYQRESSTSGPSPIGDSTQASSADDSPKSASSSSGSTVNGGPVGKPTSAPSRRSSPRSTDTSAPQ